MQPDRIRVQDRFISFLKKAAERPPPLLPRFFHEESESDIDSYLAETIVVTSESEAVVVSLHPKSCRIFRTFERM